MAGRARALAIIEHTSTAAGYQATLVYHVPGADRAPAAEPLSIQLDYDKTSLTVDDRVIVTATVTNRMAATAPMVILDLPIPAGFVLDSEDLESLKSGDKIAKYQLTGAGDRLSPGIAARRAPRDSLPLRATMPVTVTAPAARVYEYYNPDHQASRRPRR